MEEYMKQLRRDVIETGGDIVDSTVAGDRAAVTVSWADGRSGAVAMLLRSEDFFYAEQAQAGAVFVRV
jgi:hypothetical protein